MGSAPRARQGEAPANAGADPTVSPVFRAFPILIVRGRHALVQTRSSSGPLGRAIPLHPGRPGTSWRM